MGDDVCVAGMIPDPQKEPTVSDTLKQASIKFAQIIKRETNCDVEMCWRWGDEFTISGSHSHVRVAADFLTRCGIAAVQSIEHDEELDETFGYMVAVGAMAIGGRA
jgi:hypothetical protein